MSGCGWFSTPYRESKIEQHFYFFDCSKSYILSGLTKVGIELRDLRHYLNMNKRSKNEISNREQYGE